MVEKIQLTFERYRDKDNQPTCASNFSEHKVCKFYATRKFGTVELCVFHTEQMLERRNSHYGTLIPVKNCPMWSEDH